MEYTMNQVAKELGISKELVKYHRKNLPETEFRLNVDGIIMISEQGKAMIKSKLRKEKYHVDFEADVMADIHEIKEYTSNLIPNLILQMTPQSNLAPKNSADTDLEATDDVLKIEEQTSLEAEKRKYAQLEANYSKLVNQIHAVGQTLQVVNGQLQQNGDDLQRELVKLLTNVSNGSDEFSEHYKVNEMQ